MLKASVIGNLGSDPEMKYSANGAPFLRFNVASNFRTRNPEGQWEDRTEWVRVTVFGQRAESLSQYLRKGMRVFVDGRLEARPWTDQQGGVRAGLELVASDVEFMSSRSEDEQRLGGGGGGGGGEYREPRPSGGGGGGNAPRPRPAQQSRPPADDDGGDLDDLPF
ncbi:MAG: single-stranded DNA-binding protein [Chloroflexi bacterium]|nr:single-stranded DNA-binding protein [Chloroflexota bacterium]